MCDAEAPTIPMPEVPTASQATSRMSACRGRLGVAAILIALALGGCASAPETPTFVPTGDPVADANTRIALAPPQDRPLWQARLGLEAMRRGDWAEARAKLDDAILAQGGMMGPSADAARARSLFHREDSKLFVGEPYERALVYYYRAIIYWMDGEPDNARACYRTAELMDSDASASTYKGDWVLPDYLDALASAHMKDDGSDALQRAQHNYTGMLPPFEPEANVLVFAEFGRGPKKYAGGEYEEELYFQPGSSLARNAVLRVAGQSVLIGAYDDVSFQATTRGGRVMDHILANKAVFKETTDLVGDAALIGAGISAYQPREHRNDGLTVGLAAVGLISKIASAATTPAADTRCWDNLPQGLGFAGLKLAPGQYPATVEFRAADGSIVSTREFTLPVNPAPANTVLLLSELTP